MKEAKGIMPTLKPLLKGSLLILTLLLGACSHHGAHKPSMKGKGKSKDAYAQEQDDGDGPPEIDLDVTHIPNATPKIEPMSRYGNPSKYEVFGVNYHTMPRSKGFVTEGTASWYGRKFHGQRTSSGEPYDMYGMTAAHKSLPLPTYAKVENLRNGKEVIVKINDRGPFVKDRILDLSYAAAKKLGIHATGTGKVRVTAIDPVAWHKQQKEHTRLASKSKNAGKKSTKPIQVAANSTAAKPTQVPSNKATTAKPTQGVSAKATTAKSAQVATKSTAAKPTQVATKSTATKPTQVATKSTAAKPTQVASSKATSKSTPAAKASKQIYIQLGAFSQKTNAQKLADRATTLTQALNNVDVHVLPSKKANKDSFKVRVGPLKDEKVAQDLQKKLVALNGTTPPKVVYE